jgi:aspartyl-tRNA(Asn)/glutamyl-tRNA(Gln) amidotransferase subunit A
MRERAHTVAETAERVARGDVTAEALTRSTLDAIRASAPGTFLSIAGDAALEAARAVDQKRARGEALGPLAGVPIAVKDALVTTDMPTTAGSRILLSQIDDPPDPARGFRSPYDATAVARLRAAGAILVAKTNMDEFAMGSSNENSAFPPPKNPHDPTRVAGGSSGGSAVAVAAGLVPASIGSDTGGSIRQPASFVGAVGVKPTYGRVSRFGLIAFASSLDQIGAFASDVDGARRVLATIAGHDPADETSLRRGAEDLVDPAPAAIAGLRIGVPEEYFAEGLDADVARRVRDALAIFEARGATLVPITLPHTRYAVATYYVIATAEASSNLARFDGVRYGLAAPADSLGELYRSTRNLGFGREVKRRILLGTFVLSAGYYDAYYVQAQRARTLIRRDFSAAFERVDVIAAPTSPTVAFPLGARTADPLAMYLSDVCTLPASLAGLPALSLPTPSAAGELPVGLQIIARPLDDARLFGVARAFEAALDAGA